MTNLIARFALAAIAVTPAVAAHGQATFHEQRIAIAGNVHFDARAINKRGMIAGTLFDLRANTQSAVVDDRGTITTLPAPYDGSGVPIPRAINDRGDVLGYAYEGIQPHMFLWQAGQYNPVADVALVVEQQMGPPPLPLGLNGKDDVFYTIITGQQNPTDPIYGNLTNLHPMPYLMRYQTAYSLNASSMLAGTTFYEGASAVFVGRGKNFRMLLPPNAKTATGGFVNNAGSVAGAYIDNVGKQRGFVEANNEFTSFDMPEAAVPHSVAVSGLNASGRVVGTYTSQASGQQHGFLYNGKNVNPFGSYGGQDSLAIALNDKGVILVSQQIGQQADNYRSYRVTCEGNGC